MLSTRTIGLSFLVLGAMAIFWPAVATIAVEQLIAWLLVLGGLFGLSMWWSLREAVHMRFVGVFAGLNLILGLIFLFAPMAGARTLTMVLAVLFLLEGGATIAVATGLRRAVTGWIWMMVSGLVSLLMAVLILAGWPDTASWAIGLLFGVNLLTTGMALLMLPGRSG